MSERILVLDAEGEIESKHGLEDLAAALDGAKACDGLAWIDLTDPDRETLERLREPLQLHPLAVQDALSGRQQPKVQRYEHHLFVVVWDLVPDGGVLAVSQVFLFLAGHWLLTVQHTNGHESTDYEAILHDRRHEVGNGPAAAAYTIMADITTRYSRATADIESELEQIESDVFDADIREDVHEIYRVRQNIGHVDRAVSGLSAALEGGRDHLSDLAVDRERLEPYLEHLIDGLTGTAAMADDHSRSIDAVISSHESNVATRQNKDMRTISALAALFAIPTLIAGIYGMNFQNLPLVESDFGWAVVAVVIIVADVTCYLVFKRRRWI
ncbi:CorA family divalent cation transporter [Microlunatus parietis]|uniref:Magnesium transporter n=1 Tax=Microlunatus parietis TaxID=682979 RepID=A0A7Y9LBQ0_9ACTN|nr:CorA family divalent cation transporter [Microlunatus parietis]NYE70051.1 magnesium transporter [Microlunatus parietis]